MPAVYQPPLLRRIDWLGLNATGEGGILGHAILGGLADIESQIIDLLIRGREVSFAWTLQHTERSERILLTLGKPVTRSPLSSFVFAHRYKTRHIIHSA